MLIKTFMVRIFGKMERVYLDSMVNTIAVLTSPFTSISLKKGMHISSYPVRAINPLAIAIPFIA